MDSQASEFNYMQETARTVEPIPPERLVHRGVYRIHSRNLAIGVFDRRVMGYLGLRLKFGIVFVFTEYDRSTGAPHGTASAYELIGQCPVEIPLKEIGPSRCSTCESGEYIGYVQYAEAIPLYSSYSGKDWLAQGQWVCMGCTDPKPYASRNHELHELLLDYDPDIEDDAEEERARMDRRRAARWGEPR